VTWAIREKNYSQRRACGLVGLHPKTYRYATKRSGDEEHRRRLRELASQRRRFGYRRLGLMLERQGIKLNRKKLYRLYKEERLSVRKRGGRKRALGTRAPMVIPQGPQSALVARLRDRYVCEWPTLPYPHAGRRLHQRVPGPGSGHLWLTSNAILSRQQEHDVEWYYIAPGKPMQNGFVESFNGRKPRRGTPDHRRMED